MALSGHPSTERPSDCKTVMIILLTFMDQSVAEAVFAMDAYERDFIMLGTCSPTDTRVDGFSAVQSGSRHYNTILTIITGR
ncbi:hypothetical protein EVAR_65124_1 [Eumeta japonica]|uniref:Uncharacterized protein n=1 Tax=Eumeta variegata TaxID=151549 RepID=A0A4C1Z6H1_EUMVA|nr:hypothetical protein EVAR_65124_1 [Eumeta japonica]